MPNGELNLIHDPALPAVQPMPARYLQIPTVVTRFLRSYFAQTTHRWLDAVEHLVYQPDRGPSQDGDDTVDAIEIFRSDEYRGDAHRDLPKLVVRRNAVAVGTPGISAGRRSTGPTSLAAGRLHAKHYTGSLIVFGLSRQPGQADLIAAEAEQLLSHFGEQIRCELSLRRFQASQVGEPGSIKEFPDFFATPVVVDYIYEDNVELTQGRFPIRRLKLDLQ